MNILCTFSQLLFIDTEILTSVVDLQTKVRYSKQKWKWLVFIKEHWLYFFFFKYMKYFYLLKIKALFKIF